MQYLVKLNSFIIWNPFFISGVGKILFNGMSFSLNSSPSRTSLERLLLNPPVRGVLPTRGYLIKMEHLTTSSQGYGKSKCTLFCFCLRKFWILISQRCELLVLPSNFITACSLHCQRITPYVSYHRLTQLPSRPTTRPLLLSLLPCCWASRGVTELYWRCNPLGLVNF